ncbi:pyocin activator protein PrtN [Vibrio sp. S11_S32]|uniref:pyocin activator PrtN family protein n=1 Tax=Vibrio sp. S11_S32 TaxID=2720225 RepID=UPI0016806A9D|nr:pyocin activator PrtN family protein [Vibrio sp. S11_S32]MBD1576276.1 pyocin activator protein PrtN [Vibrio sp. S11_S32]
MNTKYALHARFGNPVVHLEDICEEFFGISPKTAKQKAISQVLPIATFRLDDSQRCPIMVDVSDLGDYIDKRRELALADWRMVHG